MRPPCHNRPAYAPGRWLPTGRTVQSGTRAAPGAAVAWDAAKPVLRWHPRWFEDRCVVRDGRGIGPNGEDFATAHGYDCRGCRWHGDKVVDNLVVIHSPGREAEAIRRFMQETPEHTNWTERVVEETYNSSWQGSKL